MSRRIARESAFKILYSLEINKEDFLEQFELFMENHAEEEIKPQDQKYIKQLIEGYQENKKIIDEAITKNLKSWSIERIAKIDLTILRIAIYEILIREDIPVAASINEAIEISKIYGGKDSSVFINGVLGEVAKQKQ